MRYRTSTDRTCCTIAVYIDQVKELRQSFSVQSYAYFPVCDFDLCEEMSLYFLYQQYQSYLKTGQGTLNAMDVSNELNKVTKNKGNQFFGSFGQNINSKIDIPGC